MKCDHPAIRMNPTLTDFTFITLNVIRQNIIEIGYISDVIILNVDLIPSRIVINLAFVKTFV